MKYKYLLFDWDGTLAHSLPPWISAARKSLIKRDIHLTDVEIAKDVIINLTTGLPNVGVTDVEECIEEIVALEEIQTIHERPLHLNIQPILKKVAARKILTALVTNSHDSIISRSLGLHDLETFFTAVVTGDHVTNRKPHPEPVLLALKKLDALEKKEKALMVGDSVSDILAARAAGIKVAYHYPAAHEAFYRYEYIKELKPDYVIREFKELLDMV